MLVRYFLIQFLGWVLLGAALGLFHLWFDLSLWIVWSALGLMVVKDLVLYPWVRHAYSDTPGRWVGVERVLGQRGLVVETLSPRGRVLVSGERWAAESATGRSIQEGGSVVVLEVDGLTLKVSEEKSGDSMTA